ncbi:type VII secretion integral membrane protein EccD [Luedemannella flava]
MTAPGSISLARVTVAAPQRRIDVALPDGLVLAELLPHLLRHAGEAMADEGETHGGWVLRRATGTTLDTSRSLAAQGVRDGEVLHLAPGRLDWPEFAYDDVVEVIASGSRRSGHTWTNQATRRTGFAVAGTTFAVGLVQATLSGPPWGVATAVCLGLAGLLAIVGVLVSRAFADARAGAALAGFGLPFAFLGGLLLAAPEGVTLLRLGAPNVLLGSAALLVASVVGYIGAGAVHRVFMAGIVAALMGTLAATFSLAGMSAAGAAAIALTVVAGLLPGYPLFATWLGKLPVPRLPDRAEDILRERPMPERSAVFAAVARASSCSPAC